jgi:hypothetical protein
MEVSPGLPIVVSPSCAGGGPSGQLVRRVEVEEMAEVAALNLAPAELTQNQVVSHASDCKTRREVVRRQIGSISQTTPLPELG